jgi:hypothetical protein
VSGRIQRSTSSERYKTDIADYQANLSTVLQLRSRCWRDIADVEADPDSDRWHVGLIAEEVDALGLTEYVDYNPDGSPERVTYDRLCIALLEIAQSQEERLTALEAVAGVTPAASRVSPTVMPKRMPVPDAPDDDAGA